MNFYANDKPPIRVYCWHCPFFNYTLYSILLHFPSPKYLHNNQCHLLHPLTSIRTQTTRQIPLKQATRQIPTQTTAPMQTSALQKPNTATGVIKWRTWMSFLRELRRYSVLLGDLALYGNWKMVSRVPEEEESLGKYVSFAPVIEKNRIRNHTSTSEERWMRRDQVHTFGTKLLPWSVPGTSLYRFETNSQVNWIGQNIAHFIILWQSTCRDFKRRSTVNRSVCGGWILGIRRLPLRFTWQRHH